MELQKRKWYEPRVHSWIRRTYRIEAIYFSQYRVDRLVGSSDALLPTGKGPLARLVSTGTQKKSLSSIRIDDC